MEILQPAVSHALALNRIARLVMLGLTFFLALSMSALAQDAPGQYVSFDAPHPANKSYEGTGVAAINRQGWIVGTVHYGGKRHGYLRRQNGTFIAVNVPGASDTGVTAISAYNESAGYFDDPNGPYGFFRDAAGNYTQFSVPGHATYTAGLNGSGAIVGTYDAAQTEGFLWDAQHGITLFGVPGANGTSPVAINGAGTIAGYYRDKYGNPQAFVRSRGGHFTKFNALVGGVTTVPATINASGQIAGYTIDATGNLACFLRDPGRCDHELLCSWPGRIRVHRHRRQRDHRRVRFWRGESGCCV